MPHGPVDIIVLTFAEPRFDGSVVARLAELAQAGIIRVLDAAVVAMGEDGVRRSLDIEDLPAEQAAVLGYVDSGTRGLFDADDVEDLLEGLAPGTAAAALAIEHVWAIGPDQAIRDAAESSRSTCACRRSWSKRALAALAGRRRIGGEDGTLAYRRPHRRDLGDGQCDDERTEPAPGGAAGAGRAGARAGRSAARRSNPRSRAAAGASMEEKLSQIERLGQLKAQGILTDEEFAQQKAAVLAS
jgi:hypothetical protein